MVARRLLNEGGAPLVSLRAIAREMGLTAPALYRYYDNRCELLEALCAQLCAELAGVARAAHAGALGSDPGRALFDGARAARGWMRAHRQEALLVFAAPTPTAPSAPSAISPTAGRAFRATFFELFSDLWRACRFQIPADEDIDPDLAAHLRAESEYLGAGHPLGLIQTFTQCWIRLYGVMCLELFECFPVESAACATALFEDTLRDISAALGIPDAYRPPRPAGPPAPRAAPTTPASYGF